MHTDDDIFESLNFEDGINGPGDRLFDETGDFLEEVDLAGNVKNAGYAGNMGNAAYSGNAGYAGNTGNAAYSGNAGYAGNTGNAGARGAGSGTADRDGSFFEEMDLNGGAAGAGGSGNGSSGNGRGSSGRKGASGGKAPRELNTVDSSVDRRKINREKETKKKSRIKKIIICTVVELITLAAIFAYGYFLRSWNMIARPEIRLDVIENNNISLEKKKEMEGYWNIAVFGVDSRSSNVVERGLNSDVIMIASINKDSGDIRLVSVFRDTYLNISEKNSYNKINQAYAIGGPEQALAALNKNLDLNIQHYVAFNWKAVAEGINILGGVDGISISKAELFYINAYITETVKVTGIGSHQLTSTGVQHLDGVQAVAYGRLRYMDNDFARTERQRIIIKAAFEKAKTAGFSVLNNIMVVCFPQVATNVDFNEVIAMAQNISKYNIADTGGFPWARGDANIGSKGDCVVPTTLESNVVKLHEFLFGDTNYTPSDAVLAISEKIKSDSSLYKEGKFIESVSTNGGVIQKPKVCTAAPAASKTEKETDVSEEVTLGVDEDGNYIYPTDEDGNIIIPTDADGEVVYPTDADGNIIREQRPTELSGGDLEPGQHVSLSPGDDLTGSDDAYGPGGSPSGSLSGVTTNPTRSAGDAGSNMPGDPDIVVSPAGSQTSHGTGTSTSGSSTALSPSGSSSGTTPGGSSGSAITGPDGSTASTASANPGGSGSSITGPIVSADGPGSISSGSSSDGTSGPGASSGTSTSGSSGSGTAASPSGSSSGSSTASSSSGTASPGSESGTSSGSSTAASPSGSGASASSGSSGSGTATSPSGSSSSGSGTVTSPSGSTSSGSGTVTSPSGSSSSGSGTVTSPSGSSSSASSPSGTGTETASTPSGGSSPGAADTPASPGSSSGGPGA